MGNKKERKTNQKHNYKSFKYTLCILIISYLLLRLVLLLLFAHKTILAIIVHCTPMVYHSSNNYLDLLLASIIHADNCGYLHLSNLKGWSIFTTSAVQSLVFAKSMIKLQLDFITNLHHHVTTLAACL